MDGIVMKLCECEIGRSYLVEDVLVDEAITRRLEALGVNEGTPVLILNKKGSGSVIVKVRGRNLELRAMDAGHLLITGTIQGVDLT